MHATGTKRVQNGALAFLDARDDVKDGRIGGLGLSTGADVLIHVAPERRELKAVVSDGATAASFADQTATFGIDESAPYFWTLLTAGRVFSGYSPGPPLDESVPTISPTPPSSHRGRRLPDGDRFQPPLRGGSKKAVRVLGASRRGPHRCGPRARRGVRGRVIGFFDEALLERGNP